MRLLNGQHDIERPTVGGLHMEAWLALWWPCHAFVQNSPVRLGFPDGRPMDRQPAALVNVFQLIEGCWFKYVKQEMDRNASQ